MSGKYGYGRGDEAFKRVVLKTRQVAQRCSTVFDSVSSKGYSMESMPAVLVAMDELAEALDSDLSSLQGAYDFRANEIQRHYESEVGAIGARYAQAIGDAQARRNEAKASLDEGIRIQETMASNAANERLAEERRFSRLSFFAQHKASEKKKHEATLAACDTRVEEARRMASSLRLEYTAIEKELLSAKASAAAQQRDEEVQNQNERQMALHECDQLYAKTKYEVITKCKEVVRRAIPKGRYDAAVARFSKRRPRFVNYSMPSMQDYSCPPVLAIGNIWMRPPSASLTQVTQTVLGYAYQGARQKAPNGETTLTMPLARPLVGGLQVTILPAGVNSAWHGKLLRSLVVRLLMSFPPMALNVALIDPLRNGKTFSGIRSIVDQAHENILPEIVIDERGVSETLSGIKSVMTQHIGEYQRPLEQGYFAKQPVQAILINDFPNAFNQQSLADLAQIMEGSRSFGTIVVIVSNPSYVGKLGENPDYQRIMSDKNAWHLRGDASSPNWFLREGTKLYVSFTDVDETLEAERKILPRLRDGILTAKGRKEPFEAILDVEHEETWRKESSIQGVRVPVGTAGGVNVAFLTYGLNSTKSSHHGLIAGTTGAGKTSFMHTMIMSTLLRYPAEEVQLVLIDFKEGVEFREYVPFDIPSLRSITVTTEPELALAALEDVESEWQRRAAAGINDYESWRTVHLGDFMPRIVILFDEVQELTSSHVPDAIRTRCLRIFRHMAEQGRSCGIHLFLGSQTFTQQQDIMSIAANMKTRIAVEAGSGILEDDSALFNAPDGAAIINESGGSSRSGNKAVQVAYIEESLRKKLLEKLHTIYSDPRYRAALGAPPERLFYSIIEDNPRHPCNRLIRGGKPPQQESMFPCYSPGQILSQSMVKAPYERTGERCDLYMTDNVLVVGGNVSTSESVVVGSVLSLVMDDLSRRTRGMAASDLVGLVSFIRPRQVALDSTVAMRQPVELDDLASLQLVQMVSPFRHDADPSTGQTPFVSYIDKLHITLIDRTATGFDGRSSVITVLYGLEAADVLRVDPQQLGGATKTTLEKLQEVLLRGPKVGLHSIVWMRSLSTLGSMLGRGSTKVGLEAFSQRVVFDTPEDDLRTLTTDTLSSLTDGAVVVYDRDGGERFCVRPMTLPSRGWLSALAKAHKAASRERRKGR